MTQQIKQTTLDNIINCTGKGVHSGQEINIKLVPAPADTGIIFKRTDIEAEIPALYTYVTDTVLCTTISHQGASIRTIEHLLSALAGLGVDNLIIEIDGPELPIMDGSASAFVFLIESAGIKVLEERKKFIKILKTVEIALEGTRGTLSPYDGCVFSTKIDFSDRHPDFTDKNQSLTFNMANSSYVREISRARTFGFFSDYEYLKEKKLSLGASLDNVLVFDHDGVMNKDGKRFPDECVRHKMLDAIGDLYLMGHTFIGRYDSTCPGHTLHHLLVSKLMEDPSNYEVVYNYEV